MSRKVEKIGGILKSTTPFIAGLIFYVDYDADADIEFTLTHDVEVMPSFDSMGLKEDLLRGIYAYGMLYIRVFLY